ncbi:MAG: hypothetical protein JSS99_10615 [Actinobacteria bacterium]|nr:hypothetical protein [Actinomycetota bacterium]
MHRTGLLMRGRGRARRLLRALSDARVIACVALLVALTGVTPADAVRAARNALFARNAGAVDGISASRTPHARRLLPLGADGRFPASVVPPGPRGPRGVQGPAGARGPSDARVDSRADVPISPNLRVPVEVGALPGLAPGSYLVLFTSAAHYREPNRDMYVVCETRLNGRVIKSTHVIVGEVAEADGNVGISSTVPVTISDRSDLSVTCWGDQTATSPDGRAVMIQPTLSALSVGSLTLG